MIKISDKLKKEYGEKIYKISLTSGCTCPNRDGVKGVGGCAFCSTVGSGDFAATGDIDTQIEKAKELIRKKTSAKKFIAYFQSFSNTYGDKERLFQLYKKVVDKEDIAILSLATRPDCIDEETLDMLKRLKEIKPVWVELGLQTIDPDAKTKFNLQYDKEDFSNAVKSLKEIDVEVITHVIFGLPDSTKESDLDTIRYVASLNPSIDGIKIQMLHVLKNTAVGNSYSIKPFPLYTLEEYGELLSKSIRILPENIIIHRITGDPPRKDLIAPLWTIDKKKNLNYLNKLLNKTE